MGFCLKTNQNLGNNSFCVEKPIRTLGIIGFGAGGAGGAGGPARPTILFWFCLVHVLGKFWLSSGSVLTSAGFVLVLSLKNRRSPRERIPMISN